MHALYTTVDIYIITNLYKVETICHSQMLPQLLVVANSSTVNILHAEPSFLCETTAVY
jgi:hypothetical protein